MTTSGHVPSNVEEPAAGGSEPAGRQSTLLDEWKHVTGPSPTLVAVLSVLSAVTLVAVALYFAGVLTRPTLSNIDETETSAWVPSFELPENMRWIGSAFTPAFAVPETGGKTKGVADSAAAPTGAASTTNRRQNAEATPLSVPSSDAGNRTPPSAPQTAPLILRQRQLPTPSSAPGGPPPVVAPRPSPAPSTGVLKTWGDD